MTVLRTLKRRYGIAAKRVAVHTRWPWYVRWVALTFVGGVLLGVAWMTYEFGRNLAGFDSVRAAEEQTRLESEVQRLQEDNAALRNRLAAVEGQMQIEQSTRGGLAGQLQTLSDENALIREDLAFFQTLMTARADAGKGVTINRFRVRADAMPGQYRYQLLVVQARTRSKVFQGRLQLVVDWLGEDGGARTLVVPQEDDRSSQYDLRFKFYQRVDGAFTVPANAVVKRVHARVLEEGNDMPQSTQSVDVS